MPESTHDRIDRERKAALPPDSTWDEVAQDVIRFRAALLDAGIGHNEAEQLTRDFLDDLMWRPIAVVIGKSAQHFHVTKAEFADSADWDRFFAEKMRETQLVGRT